ncbi:MAG: GGDEF domain-containing protein [Lachnospiraceae bacterium]
MSVLDLQSLDPYSRELVDKIEQNRTADPKKSMEEADRLIDYAKEKQLTDVYAYALFSKAYSLYILNDTSRAYYVFERAIQPTLESKQWELAARTYCCMGIICSCQGNIPAAMDYYLKGMLLCETHQIISVYVITSCNIGILYQGFHDLKSAAKYFQICIDKVESVRKQTGDYEPMFSYDTVAIMYYNKTYVLLEMREETKALEVFNKIEKLESRIREASLALMIKMLKAKLFYALGKPEEAEKCIQEVDEARLPVSSIIDSFDDFIKYAEFLKSIERDEEFFHVVSRMEESVKTTNSTYLNRKLIQLKADFYSKNQRQQEYLKETGVYYELSRELDKELEKSNRESFSARMKLEDEKRIREKLKKEAVSFKIRSEYDALTGLRNRNKIMEISEKRYAECLKRQKPLAAEILDIDYFKQYNDNYGHQKGDIILMKVASALRSLERHRGVYTGRYGGDEFIILYIDRTYDEVREFVQELKNTVEKMKLDHEYSLIHDRVTLSQGVYLGVPNEQSGFWDFLHAADQALYDVKKAGRNDYNISETMPN